MSDLFDALAAPTEPAPAPSAPEPGLLGLPAAPLQPPEAPESLIKSLASQAPTPAPPTSNVSSRDRLVFGGLLLAGGAPTGRAAYSGWRTTPEATALDETPEQQPLAPAPKALRSLYPGLPERSAKVMLGADSAKQAEALARFVPRGDVPDERLAGMSTRLDQYKAGSTDAESAAFDWSVFDRAHEANVLGDSATELRQLYDRFADGDALDDEDWEKLSGAVRSAADALEHFNPDLTVGLTGKLHAVEFTGDRALPVVHYPFPPVGDAFSDDAYRAMVLDSLNPSVQAPTATRVFEDLFRQGETNPPPPGELSPVGRDDVDAFWGLDFGIDAPAVSESTIKHITDAYDQTAENLAGEFGPLSPNQVQAMVLEVWRLNKQAHRRGGWENRNPYRIKTAGEENPAFLAAISAGNEMPGSLTGAQGESMSALALTSKAADGLTVFVDQYDTTHAMAVNRQTDARARNLYPGPVGADGVPRWVTVEPLAVRSLEAIDDEALSNPAVVIETVPSGLYSGTEPGDAIAFDWTQGKKLPPWANTAAEYRGGVGRSRPERYTEQMSRADLVDGDTVRKLLGTHAWAVYRSPTPELESKLRNAGFDPVALEGGSEPGAIVFGIAPSTAARFVPNGTVLTHGGEVANSDEIELGDDDEQPDVFSWVIPNRAGDFVELSPPLEPGSITPSRISERVQRFTYRLDQQDAHRIAALAADLEHSGGANLVLYSRQPEIEGFEAAREYVFNGPGGVKIARTADPTVGASNAVPVHVRRAGPLPKRALQPTPEAVEIDGVQFEESNGRKRVVVEAEGDLYRRHQEAQRLAHRFGLENVDLVFNGETIPLFQPAPMPAPSRTTAEETPPLTSRGWWEIASRS